MGFAENFIRGYTMGTHAKLAKEREVREQQEFAQNTEFRKQQLERQAKLDTLEAGSKKLSTQISLAQLQEGRPGPRVSASTMGAPGLPEGAAGPSPEQIQVAGIHPEQSLDLSFLGLPNQSVRPRTAEEISSMGLAQKVAEAQAAKGVARVTPPTGLAGKINLPLGPTDPPILSAAVNVYEAEQRAKTAAADRAARPEPGMFQSFQVPQDTTLPDGTPIKAGSIVGINWKSGRMEVAPLGVAPTNLQIPQETRQRLSGSKTAIQSLSVVRRQIEEIPQAFGPIWGQVKTKAIERLGGVGATDAEKELYVRMRALVRDQAFSEGGKALTPTEKEEFTEVNPRMSDTVEQAIVKARISHEYLRRKLGNDYKSLSPLQQKIVDPDIPEILRPKTAEEYLAEKGLQ